MLCIVSRSEKQCAYGSFISAAAELTAEGLRRNKLIGHKKLNIMLHVTDRSFACVWDERHRPAIANSWKEW